MTETRNYVVLAKSADGRSLHPVGTYPAVDSEDAIRQGIQSYDRQPPVQESPGPIERPPEPSAWVAVSERDWVERPVVREVQTRLRIGEREFVLDAPKGTDGG